MRRSALLPLIVAVPALLAACNGKRPQPEWLDFGGDAGRGITLIRQNGCGSCHVVPGIKGANGMVGPPLVWFGRRVFVAGVLRNTPDNLVAWLRDPQRVVPGNAMPDMGLSEQDARDVAAYLYTLR